MRWNVNFYEELDSTNAQIRRLSQAGAGQGLVVAADKQSAGRGRRGRTWESPAGDNLYFSVLLRPDMKPDKAPMLTLVMAYSVAKILGCLVDSKKIQIKWPNDIVLSDKKVCGILTEMHLDGSRIDDVVIGVGINVNTQKFSQDLKDKATSLRAETHREIDREEILKQILQEFQKNYEDFLITQDLSLIQDKYNQILINRNREVVVLEPGEEYRALALGINQTGELMVKKENGSVENVFAGEVSVRGLYGYV